MNRAVNRAVNSPVDRTVSRADSEQNSEQNNEQDNEQASEQENEQDSKQNSNVRVCLNQWINPARRCRTLTTYAAVGGVCCLIAHMLSRWVHDIFNLYLCTNNDRRCSHRWGAMESANVYGQRDTYSSVTCRARR